MTTSARAENLARRLLAREPLRAEQLIRRLEESGFDSETAREAIIRLIESRHIRITRHRLLGSRKTAA